MLREVDGALSVLQFDLQRAQPAEGRDEAIDLSPVVDALNAATHGAGAIRLADDPLLSQIVFTDPPGALFPTGAQVRAARNLLGWSQDKLARVADVAVSSISALETGRRPLSPRIRSKISAAIAGQGLKAETLSVLRSRDLDSANE